MAKYKFQIENGNISDGSITVMIKDGVAEIDDMGKDLAPEIKRVIKAKQQLCAAHGGILVEKPRAKRKAAKPVKWQNEDGEK